MRTALQEISEARGMEGVDWSADASWAIRRAEAALRAAEMLTVEDCKACPSCTEEYAMSTTETRDAFNGEFMGVKIACFECGALGPRGRNLHDAVERWNEMEIVQEFLEI